LLAFLDKRSSAYWRGTYDQATDMLDLHAAKNETQVRHFAAQNGFSLPSFIPEWEMIFDPRGKFRVDVEAQRINLFQPSEFMKSGVSWSGKRARSFPTIQKVMHHALGIRPGNHGLLHQLARCHRTNAGPYSNGLDSSRTYRYGKGCAIQSNYFPAPGSSTSCSKKNGRTIRAL
jgi:hypothetical protein